MGIIERSMEREITWEDVTRFEVIGLDEIALKKGHRDGGASITGRMATETVIVGGVPDRRKAPVKTFLSSQQSFSQVQVYTFGLRVSEM